MAPAVETMPPHNEAAMGDGSGKANVVGIIYPPPEVRNIVDKTAAFVARNGPEFEARIRQNEINNPKFNFLNTGDPYHAYYQYKVREIREGNPPEAAPTPAAPQPLSKPVLGPSTVPSAQLQKQQEILKQVQQEIPQVPKEPPPEFEFVVDPPSISAMELDIVKLTAQFVARNGRQFLTSLMNREARNYQFDFLRPQHSLFQYFTRLLEQYTKVLIPPKDLMTKLQEESTNPAVVVEQVKKRADWQRHQEAKKRREEEIAEKERISYAQIDWHDFVVVETVDYQPFELGNFPPPTTPEDVGARVLLQERYEDGQDVEMQLESDEEQGKDMDQSESEEEAEAPVRAPPPPPPKPPTEPKELPPPPLPPTPENVIVRKDYNPKAAPRPQARPPAPDEYLISPITGERIPASQVAEHMRIGLLDPRWVEQRDRQLQEKMAQESVYAPGSAIESSLRQLAERRTDIFGVGVEETAIGKKIGEEEKRKDEKAPWEGPADQRAATVSIQEQIAQIHKSKGLVADDQRIGPKPSDDENKPGVVASAPPKPPSSAPMTSAPVLSMPRPVAAPTVILTAPQPPIMMVPITPPAPIVVAPAPFGAVPGFVPQQPMVQPQPMPVMQPRPQHIPESHMEAEPPAKRMRSEDQLMPEEAFLVRYPGPLRFHIAVPLVNDKSGWKLQGQTLDYSLPPTETVAAVKAKIQEATGLPPAKQKLVWEGLYFKDQFSLAYYNVMPDAVVQLQLKERGGRKK